MQPLPDPFEASLADPAPPSDWPLPAAALWWDAKGDWAAAHDLVASDEQSRAAAWVHAFLHRKEPDLENARYWYHRAGRPVAVTTFEEERLAIARSVLAG